MSLKHTILGFLKKSPKTGYDIQKKIEASISHFWPSTQSQIYRTLSEMTVDGMILPEIHYQEEKPNKKVYSLTDKGNEELLRWLSTPIDIPNHRNQLLVQLFFSESIAIDTIISNLRHYKAVIEKRLSFLTSQEAKDMMDLSDSAIEKTLFTIISQNGIRLLQNEIEWADESIELLERDEGGNHEEK